MALPVSTFKILYAGERQDASDLFPFLQDGAMGASVEVRRVSAADDLAAALAQEQWDTILVDWPLNDYGLLPVLQNGAQRSVDQAFIALVDQGDEAQQRAAREAGAREVLAREDAPERLLSLITASQPVEKLPVRHQPYDELVVLHSVASAAFEASSENELIERVTNLIAETIYPKQFGILLLDPDTQKLYFHKSYRGLPRQSLDLTLDLGTGVTGTVAQSGNAMNVPEVDLCELYVRCEPGIHSELCVPMRLHGEVFGVINAESERLFAFSADDQRLLETLANQLGIAIERLRNEEALRRRLAQLGAIHDASQEIAAASLDVTAVCQAIHAATARLLDFDVFTISRWDRANHENEALFLIDDGKAYPPFRIKDDQGWSSYVLHTGSSLRINDFPYQGQVPVKPVRFGGKKTVRSVLVVPLKLSGRIVGTFSVQSYRKNEFDWEDMRMLELMAGHAAIALENARLYEEVSRQALTFANMFDAIVITDNQSIITDWNPAAERMYGYTREEVLGQPVTITQPAEARDVLQASIIENLSANGRWEGEISFARKNGTSGVADLVVLPVLGAQGQLIATIGVNRDITQRKEAEEALRISQGRLAGIIDSAMDGIVTVDEAGMVFMFNHAAEVMFGYSASEVIGRPLDHLMPEVLHEMQHTGLHSFRTGDQISGKMGPFPFVVALRASGEEFPAEVTISKVPIAGHTYATTIIRDVSERVRSQSEMSRLAGVVQQAAESVVITDLAGDIVYVNPYFERVTGYRAEEVMGKNPRILKSGHQDRAFYQSLWETILSGHPWTGTMINRCKDDSLLYENATIFPVKDSSGVMINFAAVKRDISEEVQREREMQAILTVSTALRKAELRAEMLPIILDQLLELLNGRGAVITFVDPINQQLYVELGRGSAAISTGRRFELEEGISGLVFAPDGPFITDDILAEPRFKQVLPIEGMKAVVGAPLLAQGEKIGIIWIGRSYPFSLEEFRVLQAVADMSANAIHRASLHERTIRYAEQTVAITAAGRAMAETLNLPDILGHLSASVNDLVGGVSILAILKLNPGENICTCIYAACDGVLLDLSHTAPVRFDADGNHPLALAIRSHEPQIVDDLSDLRSESLPVTCDLPANGSAVIVPLVARGKVQGAMELISLQHKRFTSEDAGLLTLIASTTATAIENADLYQGLQLSNRELLDAYDRTIEGWSRALDLRDRETEFHTQRVTDITLDLARESGMSGEHLVHIRRGAMLHDIGKMGVPDRILLKQEALSDEEWAVMRMHPLYAYEMLAPIAYLRPALIIPYCHHEKWDGSGYPRGLKGEEIPLEARLFALADVYDALTHVRPYRPAWPRSQAIQYIREQSGKHFDPKQVKVFMRLVEKPI